MLCTCLFASQMVSHFLVPFGPPGLTNDQRTAAEQYASPRLKLVGVSEGQWHLRFIFLEGW